MKNLALKTGLATALVTVGVIGASTMGLVSAQTQPANSNLTDQGMRPMHMQMHGKFKNGLSPMDLKNVKRDVQNISDGVLITVTSTDKDTVTKLQSMKMPAAPKDANLKVTVAQTNVDNGVQIKISSSDADTVKKIQEDSNVGRGPGFGIKGHMGGHGMGMMMFNKNVQRSVKNLDNGVQVTLTSSDPDTVKKLQEMEAKMTEMQNKVASNVNSQQ